MRPTKDEYFSQMARLVATRSTCLRRAVGCVLVNELGHVLATGYNGVAAGFPHCNQGVRHYDERDEVTGVWPWRYPNACPGASAESGTGLEACEAIHAEQNALLQCTDVQTIYTAYVTTAPCVTCTKLLLNTSCHRIVCDVGYAASGQHLWERSGRIWVVNEGRRT